MSDHTAMSDNTAANSNSPRFLNRLKREHRIRVLERDVENNLQDIFKRYPSK